MSQDLCGKWYVYRYSIRGPVLKASETILDIQQTEDGCLAARFELSGWAEPAEIEMVSNGHDWHSKKGAFDFLEFRWAHIVHDDYEPLLMGQVLDAENPVELRDLFIAVRSRRTAKLPKADVYELGRFYYTPYGKREDSWEWINEVTLTPGRNEGGQIDLGGSIYKGTWNHFRGGIEFDGRAIEGGQSYHIRVWVLPVVEPGELGHLLAVGYHEAHGTNSGVNPHCQGGAGGC